ncbi:unnamed protein product [Candidula unifasciata]|uniref:UBZ1-type domain-containing protein n=1 Tax=Candidula unifasciata TaxID=100452 RepID=A0A8S3ZHK0_9EUPU|nr:unnamed protein product [Candidula unifasciata]
MSNNIQHEAVYPPAVHHLRRMAYPSPTRNAAKGSYELYEPQQKTQESPELKKLNASVETAPGSPGSYQDYSKVVEKLQKELEESKKKETMLQQMLSDLKNPLSSSVPSLFDNSYFDGSPANESMGEHVKDAHIKHLQRQVTVLQASLYKSEGWASRVASAVKERDKALDDVARLTSELREIQENNCQLLRKIESLNTALQEAHRNLQAMQEQLQSQNYSAQLVAQLKEEIVKQKTEINTLKESVDRLDLENKTMKDPSIESGSQSLGNIACSQELEHLHKVVDRLKSTVLQQRTYLLQLRQPNNTKSMSMSSPAVNTDGALEHDPVAARKSSSPRLRGSGLFSGESAFVALPQRSSLAHSNQPIGFKSGSPRETVFETQSLNGSDFLKEGIARRKSNSREMLSETYNMDVLNLPCPLPTPAAGLLEPNRQVAGVNNRNGYFSTDKRHSPPGFLKEQNVGDGSPLNGGNIGLTASGVYEAAKTAQQKMFQQKQSQSEVVGNRNTHEGLGQDKSNSKSDNLGWQMRQWNLTSANNSAMLGGKGSSEFMTFNQSEPEPGLMLNQAQRYQSPRLTMQETQGRMNEANMKPAETHGQYMLNGNAVQVMIDNSDAANYSNMNVNSAKTHLQQIYKLSSAYQEGQERTQQIVDGGKIAMPPPPLAHNATFQATGANQEVVYVNASGNQGMFSSTSSSVDPDPSASRLNSDKLCPVCNNDYSQVSMEEFQTHVFECFDDENPPETMKAHPSSPERLCPMCSASFSFDLPQAEFERHVHGHFGEENPGEPFEILHP